MSVRRVALLTAGGFAPCLSSAVGGLIERYTEIAPDIEIIAYEHGYYGLLRGDKIVIDDEVARQGRHPAQVRRLARSATPASSSPTPRTASSAAW